MIWYQYEDNSYANGDFLKTRVKTVKLSLEINKIDLVAILFFEKT